MGDQENDELLPDGWRVEVRVRKNGKKDKCYIAPSNGLKFNSKVGVFRYLNSKSPEETVKGPTKQLSKEVMIERAAAEGLPPGWIKELKVTKMGHRVRRDPYYIDPVSGYIFRSMKDAVRYVETGEIGRLAYKPKDKDSQDEEDLEDDTNSSRTAAKKPKLALTGTKMEITSQSPKLMDTAKNEDVLDSAGTGECISRSENISGGAETEPRRPNLSEDKNSVKMDGKDSDKNVLLSPPVQGVLPDRQSSESGEIRDETKKTTLEKSRSRKKKVLDLPRRASKRLAGLALDPTPELKTSNRARRTVGKQSDETVASPGDGSCSGSQGHKTSAQPDQLEDKSKANCGAETSEGTNVLTESSNGEHPFGAPNGCVGKTEREYESNRKQGCPANNQNKTETDIKADENSCPSIDLPLGDLLSDPCIAFAIKTLTGATFETSSDKELSLESNNSKYEGLASLEEHACMQKEDEGNKKLENVATPEQHSGTIDSNQKTDENSENPLDSALADIWRDPCIEFAIKTLTGAIPVGCDLDIQDYFQQQLNTSQKQASNNFCQTEFLCQQYDTLEKPVTREQALTGNLSLQNSGGTSFHQQSGKRCNECH